MMLELSLNAFTPTGGYCFIFFSLIFETKYRQTKVEVEWRWETIEAGKQIEYRKQIVKHKHQSVDRSKNRKSVPRSWVHASKRHQ